MRNFFKTAGLHRASQGKSGISTIVFGMLWLAVVATGTVLMIGYANSPGPAGSPPTHWPIASQIARIPSQPTLIMFLHPHCPCSRASIGELALLMAHCQGRVNAQVLFLQPEEMTNTWVLTDTWREASGIPGVTVRRDEAGREARLFCTDTSGDTVLYNAEGKLLFHGGITISRGHAGDNPGRDSLQTLLLGGNSSVSNTPAFGCSLFECPVNRKP
jgi:hypothetical protein